MGDTVVKAIKEATIWLGELTVLPSDEDSTRERLKSGLYGATLGKIDSIHSRFRDVEKSAQDDDEKIGEDIPPGRAGTKQEGSQSRRRRRRRHNQRNEDRLAADFEEEERLHEAIAHDRGDQSGEGKI